jgi:hypothetical protein
MYENKMLFQKFAMAIGAAASLLLLGGCKSPEVNQSGGPNPLLHQKHFGLGPMEMKDLMVDDQTEKDFEATENPDQIKNWEGDKLAIQQLFARRLMEDAAKYGISISETTPNALYTLEAALIAVDHGHYTVPAWKAVTRMKLKVRIVGPDGTIAHELILQSSEQFHAVLAPTSGIRLRKIARDLGAKCAKTLAKRVEGSG